MAFDLVPLQPLERGYLTVTRVHGVIGWTMLSLIAAAGDVALHLEAGLPFGLIVGPVAMFGLFSIIFLAPQRWRRWGYAFTARELHVARGWLWRVHTVVPVARVQHIDVIQGPIERANGVATLSLHTAGSENSLVLLPGLTRERAEAIRDAIRARISDTPW